MRKRSPVVDRLDLKEFSKEVANTARFYAGDEKSDDISVIAMRLSR